MPPAARDFHQREAASVDQAGGAPQHGVGAFHGLDRHAGAFADGDALAHVEARQRIGDAAAIIDIRLLGLVGLAPGHGAFVRQQRLEQRGGIAQLDAFVGQDLHDAADEAIGIARGQRGQQFHQPPVGPDGGEDLRVFHLAGHDHFGDAFGLQDFDQPAECSERDPVRGEAGGFDFLRRFFLDGAIRNGRWR